MDSVVTLVAPPDGPALAPAALDAARAALAALGPAPAEVAWLAPGIACDLATPAEPAAAGAAVAAALAGQPVDLCAQPAAGRRKRLLVADMDSTIVTGESLDELAGFAGRQAEVAAITRRAMNGELDFAAALRERVAMLAGLPAAALAATLDRLDLMPGAVTLVRTMRAHGAYAALVSGGFRQFTRAVAARCGFDEDRSNELLLTDGRLAGGVAEPILGREAKLAALEDLAAARGLPLAATLAVGDGANDLPMLLAAGLGVAYRAKPAVAAAARCRVDHGDLTALLYFQGYRRSELVLR
jgi:phosphoserine phosphatase